MQMVKLGVQLVASEPPRAPGYYSSAGSNFTQWMNHNPRNLIFKQKFVDKTYSVYCDHIPKKVDM